MDQSEVFLTSRQVRERYGNASDMWLWRRENEPGSTFPKPIRINKRRFWRECDLVDWERSLDQVAA
jgi:predicted DNA-binding transcriptional regulator AlpA